MQRQQASFASDAAEHQGSRRLAVRAGDRDRAVSRLLDETPDDLWVDALGDEAGDRGATASAGSAACLCGEFAGGDCGDGAGMHRSGQLSAVSDQPLRVKYMSGSERMPPITRSRSARLPPLAERARPFAARDTGAIRR